MPNWKNIFIGTGIAAGIGGVALYARKMLRTSANIESVVTARVHSLKLDGLTIRVDARLKNPTNGSLKIKYPFVKLAYDNVTIGTSNSIDEDILLPSFGEANIEGIMIKIPVTGLLSLGGAIFKVLTAQQSAEILVTTVTTIDLGWQKKPYEKTDKITLNAMR